MTSRQKLSFKKNNLFLGIASALMISAAPLHAGESDTIRVDIKEQAAGKSLMQLAQTAGVQIVMNKGLGEGVSLPALSGDYTLSQALDKMLEGTGMTYEFTSDNLIVIQAKENQAEESESKENVDEEIVVTGSLLRNVEPTSKMKIYTAEDIQRLGVSSAEDFLRLLPQNYAGHNTLSSNDGLAEGQDLDGINTAAADLRGLGNDTTLVLINGRRTAQSPQFEGGVVNLTTIPVSAIDRVEIIFDGASARYGSDALAGVINFILKRDFTGAETAVRYEDSIFGGNKYRLTQNIGFGWGSGTATATMVYEDSKPSDSSKLGIQSNYFDRGGVNDFSIGGVFQGGTISTAEVISCEEFLTDLGFPPFFIPIACADPATGGPRPRFTPLGSLPSGFDGTESWTAADLSLANNVRSTLVRPDQGSFVQSKSLSLSVNQQVSDGFEVFTDILYSTNDVDTGPEIPTFSIGRFDPIYNIVNVPASNPFNRLGTDLAVNYIPEMELRTGLIPFNTSTSKQEQTNIAIGFNADLPWDSWQIRGSIGYNRDSSENREIVPAFGNFVSEAELDVAQSLIDSIRAGDGDFSVLMSGSPAMPLESLVADPADAATILAANSLFEQQLNPLAMQLLLQQGTEDIDGDGAVDAFNPFGDGTVQTALLKYIFAPRFDANPDSVSEVFEFSGDGIVGSWAAGDIQLGFGGEYRKDYRDYSDDSLRQEALGSSSLGTIPEPERDIKALFAELNIPLVGDENALPGIQEFMINVSARWEEYSISDSFGLVDIAPDDTAIYEPFGAASFNNTSPRVGISWQLIDSLRIRASWNEAFRAPNFFELLGDISGGFAFRIPTFDPVQNETVVVPSIGVANPELQPEISTNTSVTIEWTPDYVDGLSISGTWTRIDWDGKIGRLPFEDSLRRPDIGIRDDQGNLIRIIQKNVNIDNSLAETVDIEASYSWDSDYGNFLASLNASYISTLQDDFGDNGGLVVTVNTQDGPSDWRGRAMLRWDYDNMGANLIWNYTGSFIQTYLGPFVPGVPREEISRYVSDYKTFDLTGYYQMESGWRFEGGVRNVTNTTPPFVDVQYGFDPSRVDPRGRIMYAEVKKSFDM